MSSSATKKSTQIGSEDIFWILWYYDKILVRDKLNNFYDRFEVHQGLYGVGGWCEFFVAKPDNKFMKSLLVTPKEEGGTIPEFKLSLYRSPAKLQTGANLEKVFKKAVSIDHFYYLSECHFQEGPFTDDIGFVLVLKEKGTYNAPFKSYSYLSPPGESVYFAEYINALAATTNIAFFNFEDFLNHEEGHLNEYTGPTMPQFFENRLFIDALDYWCDYFQYEYALEFHNLIVSKAVVLNDDSILKFGNIEITKDDLTNNTLMEYGAYETAFIAGTINRPVQCIGQQISYKGVMYRVIYYKYRYNENSYFTCSFIATLGYVNEGNNQQAIPRSVYKKIIPIEAANCITIHPASPFFWGQIKEDAGVVPDDENSSDFNERVNVFYESSEMNVRDPENFISSDVIAPAYKASPFATIGAGVQYPEAISAIGLFGGDSPHLSVCLGQVFQKKGKPYRNTINDYRLTMLDGSSFYFDYESQRWILVGNKFVEIGAADKDVQIDYQTIPYSPSTCNIIWDGENKSVTVHAGESGDKTITVDDDGIILDDGTNKITMNDDGIVLDDGTRKITMNGSTVDIT